MQYLSTAAPLNGQKKMTKHLTEEQIESFKENGFISPMDALTSEEAEECLECLEDYIKKRLAV